MEVVKDEMAAATMDLRLCRYRLGTALDRPFWHDRSRDAGLPVVADTLAVGTFSNLAVSRTPRP